MNDENVLMFMTKELRQMGTELSDKIDNVNDNISEVKAEVAELRGISLARLDNHEKNICDLQEDTNKLWEKVNETDKRVSVYTSHMTSSIATPEEVEMAFENAEPYVKKLLKLKIKEMTVGEKVITLGGGGAVTIGGLVAFIIEYGPSIYNFIRQI